MEFFNFLELVQNEKLSLQPNNEQNKYYATMSDLFPLLFFSFSLLCVALHNDRL